MSASFVDWVKNGLLEAHRSSREEIGNLLGSVERDLRDSAAKDFSNDWRFAIAYNASLQAATAALAAAGYRASQDSHDYRVVQSQSLSLTIGKSAGFIRSFGAFRNKRNVSNYDIGRRNFGSRAARNDGDREIASRPG
jgi:hypothetical protein